MLRAWPLPEQPVHDGLALIEATVDRERVDIRVSHRLQMLQLILWYAGCRIEHHHDGVVTVLERLDGRQPGITVGSPEHHRASLAFVQKILHQLRLQLGGKILRGTGRTVEQLQHPLVAVDLMQGRHGAMTEAAARLFEHALEIHLRDGPAHKRTHDPIGQFVIRQDRPIGHVLGFEQRQLEGHEQSAVLGNTG